MRTVRALSLWAAALVVLSLTARAADTWVPPAPRAPGLVGVMLLLSDSTVMAENNDDAGTIIGKVSSRLRPDNDHFVNHPWTKLASKQSFKIRYET